MFRIYSVTKSFTGTIIKQLQQQGKLRLDDKITDWIEKIEKYNHETGQAEQNAAFKKLNIHPHATINDLFLHLSGIGNYSQGDFINVANAAPSKPWSFYDLFQHNEVVDQATDDKEKNNEYGKFCYSDTGYNLLALIAEHAAGTPYETMVQALCAQEKLHHTCFLPRVKELKGQVHVAEGYILNPKSKQPASSMDYDTSKGAGGLFSTAEDMLIWAERLYDKNKHEVTDDHTALITGKTPSRVGKARYGQGIMVQYNDAGESLYGHGGYARGGRSKVFYYPDSHTSVVTLESFETITPKIAKDVMAKHPKFRDLQTTILAIRNAFTDKQQPHSYNREAMLCAFNEEKTQFLEKVNREYQLLELAKKYPSFIRPNSAGQHISKL